MTQVNDDLRSAVNANVDDIEMSNDNYAQGRGSNPATATDMLILPPPSDSPDDPRNFHANDINHRALQPTAISAIQVEAHPQTSMTRNINPIDLAEERKVAGTILIRENNQAHNPILNQADDFGEIDHEVEEEFKRLTQTTPLYK